MAEAGIRAERSIRGPSPDSVVDLEPVLPTLQGEVLEAVAGGQSLQAVTGLICSRVEQAAPSVVCSILLVDRAGRLRPLAGPSLPPGYSASLEGLPIGPDVGCCGAAAHFGEPVESSDIRTDPRWGPYAALPLAAGLVACWSSPIKAADQRVVGTFAFYYRTCRGPDAFERRVVANSVHLCSLAIEHDEARARIHQLAFYDTLTGLPNRALFQERLTSALAAALPTRGQIAVFSIDLSDFKTVNDTLGYRIGDLLLCAATERLKKCVRKSDFIARLGSDEFAVLQIGRLATSEIAALAQRIVDTLTETFVLDGRNVTISANIGVAVAENDGATPEDLFKKADLALTRAKSEGRRVFRLFTPEMSERALARLTLAEDLRKAVEQDGFELFYQPLVNIATGTLTGFEALLRWYHPIRGPISAVDLVHLAEENGLIVSLGDWILRDACRQAARWPSAARVAVNISPLQFRSGDLLASVKQALAEADLAPNRLELEITENLLLASDRSTTATLRALRDHGVRISLDDFGTGYASLSYLRSFPFDKIKIDRSFVSELPHDRGCLAIMRAILALGRDLGMVTTAEGVETAEQLACLRAEACPEVQGYFYAKPQPADQLDRFFLPDAFRQE